MPTAPASLCELMLAGHSASACDLSITMQDLALDVNGVELPRDRSTRSLCPDENGPSCNGRSFNMPAPTRFRKKSNFQVQDSQTSSHISAEECKRDFRKAVGLNLIQDERAQWLSCTGESQVSASLPTSPYSISPRAQMQKTN